ncbi:hypothetical protein N7489_010148 [Penicillium chrysogenum]|nr:uncharacterized protein N7489_010148 [Penicillium chrysogenum]KAJ5229440.1 hypothetical protein N7489_010148 [Penicillium chrysogenum]KAJ5258845.1 hypothetical protein N7524_010401 [Penicillium chrysogenum]
MAQPICPLGHPSSLSQSHRGEERPPGEWAKHVKKLNYTVAKQGIALKTETLVTLDKMEAKRQLLVRNNRAYLPSSLEHNIGENAKKVECALGYIVGDISSSPCMCCERGMGPFPHCVRVFDCENLTAL